MNDDGKKDGKVVGPVLVGAEPVLPDDATRFGYLAQNRSLIIKRSLLSTALSTFIPLPVMDDYISGRIRAGLFMKLAASREVDLPQSSADVLADPKDGSALRNATVTAATLLALKLAWRKFFALLAVGRGAEEMATTFQIATVVDHYCAKLHVGGAVTREQAAELRGIVHGTVDHTSKSTLVAVFRDGGKILGRSLLEAPRWVTQRFASHAERFVRTGGNPAVPFEPSAEMPGDAAERAWLDRAARAVEDRLATVGNDYLTVLVEGFENRWKERPSSKKTEGEKAGERSAKDPADPALS